ncbi:hypothetical protein [Candidatus Chlorohelix sp.]|uniref:hypothetical protein n=1 Tax=Candidatus Chlorohelix sp. TaxID=3139201 RepID=UPI003061E7B9
MEKSKSPSREGRVTAEPLKSEKYVQGGWERLVLCATHTQVQSLNYGSPLSKELEKLRADGWTMTYSLRNTTGRTYYFRRAIKNVARRLKETAMW